MAIWKCNRCEKEFYDGGEAPFCPACQAGRSMLTALDFQAGADNGQGGWPANMQYIEQSILEHVRETAGSSPYPKGIVDEIQRITSTDINRLSEQGRNRELAARTQEQNAFSANAYAAEESLKNEMEAAVQRIQQGAEAPKKESKLKFLKAYKKKEYLWIAIVLYIVFAALLFLYNAHTSTLPEVDPEIDFRSAGNTILFLVFSIPLYVLACLTIIVLYRGFIRWFYGFTKRKEKIEQNKGIFVGKSISQVQEYYQEQISILHNVSLNNPPPEQAPDVVRSFYESAVRKNREAEDAIDRIHNETQAAIAKRKKDGEEAVRITKEDWLSDVSEAAKNYARLFERQFYSTRRDRGPVYWLFYRFCGNDGAIATASRGVGHLKVIIRVTVDISESHLFVQVTDPQGKQLIRNEQLQNYYFAAANERSLSKPAERMGYAAALMGCTLYEANLALRQAKYDESFEIGFTRSADETGFALEYEGNNFT